MANYDSVASNVKAVQSAVNGAGYSPQLAVDGVYGPATKAGVIWFQGRHGLTQDGIIGDATMAAIGPTPPGSDPLAGMKAAIAALKATQDAAAAGTLAPSIAAGSTTPAGLKLNPDGSVNFSNLGDLSVAGAAMAAVPLKTIKLTLKPAASASAAPVAAAVSFTPVAIVAAPAPSPLVPSLVGAVLGGGAGAALSSLVALPILALAGGGVALGALAGFGVSKLMHPAATMHGEADFGIDFGCDDPDEPMIVAGEIGVPANARSLMY